MLIIGERINTSRKKIGAAVGRRDVGSIQDEARKQVEAGASMIDVNCGTFVKDEPDCMAWLVDTVQDTVDVPLCIDSPNLKAIELALKGHKNGKPMVNSITAEEDRFNKLLPLILEYKTSVVALCMAGGGMPNTAEERFQIASDLIRRLTSAGVPIEDIYVDPVVCPVANDVRFGKAVLDSIQKIMTEFKGVHTICGLSNVSFGLPLRKLLNQNLLPMCMLMGLDAVILDPLDRRMMSNLIASEALLGRDDFCMNYVTAHREGRLVL